MNRPFQSLENCIGKSIENCKLMRNPRIHRTSRKMHKYCKPCTIPQSGGPSRQETEHILDFSGVVGNRESVPVFIQTGSNINDKKSQQWTNLINALSRNDIGSQTKSTQVSLHHCKQCKRSLIENENFTIYDELCDSDTYCKDENYCRQSNPSELLTQCGSRLRVRPKPDFYFQSGPRRKIGRIIDDDDDYDLFKLKGKCSRKKWSYVLQEATYKDEDKTNEKQGSNSGDKKESSINFQEHIFSRIVFTTMKIVLNSPLSNLRSVLTSFVLVSTLFYVFYNYLTVLDFLRDNVGLSFIPERKIEEVPFYKKCLNYLFATYEVPTSSSRGSFF